MKKIIFGFSIIVLVITMFCNVVCVGANTRLSTAIYTSQPPIIDGNVDKLWNTTNEIPTTVAVDTNFATAYAKLLWDEKNLYLLAVVKDSTVTNIPDDSTTNLVNFWVSETAHGKETYGEALGDWHLPVNQAGNTYHYTGNDISVKAEFKARIDSTIGGYVVEAKVPVLTPNYTFDDFKQIGFCLSIDDDVNGDNERDYVCTTQDFETKYWEVPSGLNLVTLVKPKTQNNTSSSQASKPDENASSAISSTISSDVISSQISISSNVDSSSTDSNVVSNDQSEEFMSENNSSQKNDLSDVTEETVESEQDETEKKDGSKLVKWIIFGAIIAVVLIVIIVLIVYKKYK